MTNYGKADHALFQTVLDRKLADHLAKPNRRKGRTAAEINEADPGIASTQGIRNALARMTNAGLVARNGSRASSGVYALTTFGRECQEFSARVQAGDLPDPPTMPGVEVVDMASATRSTPERSDGMELMILLMTKAATNGAGPDVLRGLADLMILAKDDPGHPTIQVLEYIWADS